MMRFTSAMTVAAFTFLLPFQAPSIDSARAEDRPSLSQLSTELAAGIRAGDTERVAVLLKDPVDVNARDPAGNTPLILASFYGTAGLVDLLLKRGADPNAANKAGVTPLVRAATDHAKVKLLLAAGAKAEVRTELGNTPLILAARRPGNAPAVKLLLDHGADARARNRNESSAIQAAAASGDLATVRLLLDGGADIEDSPGKLDFFAGMRTPLMWASFRNDLPMLRFLLERGADPNRATPFGTPLSHAAWHGSAEAAQVLIDRGAIVSSKQDFSGFTPLHWAAFADSPRPQLVNLLLAKGADPNATGGESIDAFLAVPQTPLLVAQKRGRTAIVAALEASGGKVQPAAPVAHAARALPEAQDSDRVLAAAERALALLQVSAARSRESYLRHASKQDCVSCHQHYLPFAAVGHARERGLRIDEAAAREQLELIQKPGTVRAEAELQATFHPEPAYSYGYAAFALTSAKAPPGAVTDLLVHHLATIQDADGRWLMNLPRPPIQSGDVGSTALAILALKNFGWPGRREELAGCIERGRRWLSSVEPQTNEDSVFQLLGLHWGSEPAERLADRAQALLEKQRADGGWAQLPTLESDAYATGQALYALAKPELHPVSGRAWQRGLRFLLGTQQEDGSWHVPRRAFPFQPTMASGFPHGRDSWLSAAATSWAVLALTQAIPPRPAAAAGQPAPPALGETVTRPDAAVRPVDFARDIKPVLERSCLACHGPERQRSGFRIDSAADIVKGGASGEAAIVPGHSDRSVLIRNVSGAADGLEMPPLARRDRYPALTPEEQQLLRAWIDQGAVWPKDVTLLRPPGAAGGRL